jgi:hypothetical protein
MTRTAANVVSHNAPLIGERAAARGRIAMEGGGERVGVKRESPAPASRTASNVGTR